MVGVATGAVANLGVDCNVSVADCNHAVPRLARCLFNPLLFGSSPHVSRYALHVSIISLTRLAHSASRVECRVFHFVFARCVRISRLTCRVLRVEFAPRFYLSGFARRAFRHAFRNYEMTPAINPHVGSPGNLQIFTGAISAILLKWVALSLRQVNRND